MTLRRDAALAAAALSLVVLAAIRTNTGFAPADALVGIAGAVALEALTAVEPRVVRRAWERPLVRWLALGVALLGVWFAAVVRPDPGLNALAGGLLAYLALVALVAVDVLPPTTEWRTRDS